MVEVPKIVRERLKSEAPAGEHLDPNLLSAFAEGTLTQRERADALEHLSRCVDCREVLAVMSPDPEQIHPAVLVRAGETRSWWRSPVVHWSALMAAAAVVLIAVIVGPHRERKGMSASAPAKTEPVAAEKATPDTTVLLSANVPEKKSNEEKRPAESKKKIPIPEHGPARSAGPIAGQGLGAGLVGGSVAASPQAPAALMAKPQSVVPPPPPPPSSADVQPQGAFLRGDNRDSLQAKAAPAPSRNESLNPAAPAMQKRPTVLKNSGEQAFALRRESLSARWSISNAGALQRSFDGGRNWKEVPVSDGVTFRSVSVAGSDVWAGGSNGALFHSADAGERWSRVRVQSPGAVLNGDIVRVDFKDPDHGVVATTTGETWATSDAGASWQRQ